MQKPRRPTLQDVASLVGVTKMTVSRYLRNRNRVAKVTGERIQIALDELGYIPNRVPDILSNRASRTLGVVLPSLKHPVFQQVIEGIEKSAAVSGYEVMVAHSGFEAESEEMRIQTLLSFNVDGLILAESEHSERTLKMIETAGIPYVDILDAEEGEHRARVGIDNELAALSMVSLMIERGYKKIICLSAKKGIQTQSKVQGYIMAMEEAGFEPKSLSAKSEVSVSLAKKMTRKVLDRYPETDAFFCTDDELAAGVLLECQNLNISIPDEIGIAGVHALDIGQSLMPRLASIITPDRETGEKAVLSLLAMLQGETLKSEPLEFELDEGETLLQVNDDLSMF
ncbi:LacI family DNA-binding transcriptional regulator [Enterovibrio sp. ZSDZ35]|uniref:LacI family DNA-binding transcriptional regulator n=1 Tax=Enterovibrio qingdaonensis TaxID=2899818 RepID=A0ABT5QIH8_9GAMM|nr:substrate-binding domain-containing protein [Enterovibrio sp. ZSDZ35]MDD1780778.1 LacI family DNA-binding transcriptional regulator [Enterovibrio sp. ZSDZ35]